MTLFLAGCCSTRCLCPWDWLVAPLSSRQCLPSVRFEVSGFSPVGMMHSPGFWQRNSSLGLQMLMNAGQPVLAAHCALLLNLKLSHGDYYIAAHPGTQHHGECASSRPCLPRTSGDLWAGTRALLARERGMTWPCPQGCGGGHSPSTGTFEQVAQSGEPQSYPLGSRSKEHQCTHIGCLPVAQ